MKILLITLCFFIGYSAEYNPANDHEKHKIDVFEDTGVPCWECNGTGKYHKQVTCTACGGRKSYIESMPCGACDKGLIYDTVLQEWVYCQRCKGTGYIEERRTCGYCYGSGKRVEQVVCTLCHGTGSVLQ